MSEVFQEGGLLDVDCQGVDLAAALGGRDLKFLVGQWPGTSKGCAILAPDFDEPLPASFANDRLSRYRLCR